MRRSGSFAAASTIAPCGTSSAARARRRGARGRGRAVAADGEPRKALTKKGQAAGPVHRPQARRPRRRVHRDEAARRRAAPEGRALRRPRRGRPDRDGRRELARLPPRPDGRLRHGRLDRARLPDAPRREHVVAARHAAAGAERASATSSGSRRRRGRRSRSSRRSGSRSRRSRRRRARTASSSRSRRPAAPAGPRVRRRGRAAAAGRSSPSCSSRRSAGRSPRPSERPSPRSWPPGWPAPPAPAGRSPELTPRTRDNPPNGWGSVASPPPTTQSVDAGGASGLVAALVAGGWLVLLAAIAVGRLRRGRDELPADASIPVAAARRAALESAPSDDDEARVLLLRGLRSAERDVRIASVTALASPRAPVRVGRRRAHRGARGRPRLADPSRVGARRPRAAPGVRLVPLLRHPSVVVRFSAVRLLARYPDLARRHVADLTRDPSPQVRAAALETLRGTASAEALRCATALLDDPASARPRPGRRDGRAVAGGPSAALLVPLLGDESWAVRDATREALVAAGDGVADAMLAALDDPNEEIRSGAALVLQDVGVLDHLAHGDRHGHLERILDAGGDRLRQAASGAPGRASRSASRCSARRPRDARGRCSGTPSSCALRTSCSSTACTPGSWSSGSSRHGDAGASARATTSTRSRARGSRRASASSSPRTTRAPACRTPSARCSRSTTPTFEVIVVNDGSTDDTLAGARRGARPRAGRRSVARGRRERAGDRATTAPVDPRLLVVDKPNGGKADALNAGLNHCPPPLRLRRRRGHGLHPHRPLARRCARSSATPRTSSG